MLSPSPPYSNDCLVMGRCSVPSVLKHKQCNITTAAIYHDDDNDDDDDDDVLSQQHSATVCYHINTV